MKQKIFISHTKTDYEPTKMESLLCGMLDKDYTVFCSSNPHKGIKSGKKLHEEMNRQLSECNVFMAVVTENYLRSPHCLYEMSVARFLKKQNLVIIYANDDIMKRISNIADPEWISINLNNEEAIREGGQRMMDSLGLKGELQQNNIIKFLGFVAKITSSSRTFVGMSDDTYNEILDYCQKEGITKFKNGQIYTKDEMISKFAQAKKVYIVSTTGAGLLKTLKEEALIKALGNKAEINVILPDRDSQFCQDVAEAECSREWFNPIIAKQNRYRIESEFVATIQYLNEAYCQASMKYPDGIGTITCYNSRTLLRQTIVLLILNNNHSWGWINMTMVPLRTTDTPSVAISDTNIQEGLDKMVVSHCECLMKIATDRNAKRSIDGMTLAEKLEKNCHEEYWANKRLQAQEFMKQRQDYTKILIEVAAQHPLVQGRYPNEEFQKRLNMAIRLSQEIGSQEVWFYVPGSRHKYNDVTDEISLSEAGKSYLLEHGIDENHIYADEANIKYKGKLGVYNSADECYVASCIMKDDSFGRLICVCSPYQAMRKSFYYMEFGIIPECYGVPANAMFHNPVSEYFGSLRHTVIEDHSWQDEGSEAAINSRKDRMTKL